MAAGADVSDAGLIQEAEHIRCALAPGVREWQEWADGSLAVFDDATAQTHLLSPIGACVFLRSARAAGPLSLPILAADAFGIEAALLSPAQLQSAHEAVVGLVDLGLLLRL